jgi:hypothetical protein
VCQPTGIVVDFIRLLIGLIGDTLFDWIIRREADRK